LIHIPIALLVGITKSLIGVIAATGDGDTTSNSNDNTASEKE
jgi:hypothetical protein